MSHDLASLKRALAAVPTAAFQLRLARVVTLEGLEYVAPHDWLFVSGTSYRYNLAGANCIYFSETREVALLEYDSYWKGLPGEHQPAATYYVDISLTRVVDLTYAATLKRLRIDRKDLFLSWRTAKRATPTQPLGTAALATGKFSAIRYPSNAAEDAGRSGNNFVIFQDRVRAPDSVRILGPGGKTLQQWP